MSFRLGILVTHPIQYYSPWFRHLAEKFNIEVFYAHRQNSRGQSEAGFGIEFEWDTHILEGYSYHWLANVSRSPSVNTYWGCDTPEIRDIIRNKRFDAFLVFGWYYKSALQAIRACWKNNVPVLMRGDSQLRTNRSWLKSAIKYIPYRYALPRFDAHLYVGKRNKEYLQHYGVADERLFFAPHFVDNKFFNASSKKSNSLGICCEIRNSLGIPSDGFVFLFVGKLIPKKRPADFIKAFFQVISFHKHEKIFAIVVGDGTMRSELQHLGNSRSDRIYFVGFRNQTQLSDYYNSSNAIVLPSNEMETWGLVVNEAMACNLPAIVSDAVGCAPDLIDEGITGFTYPVRDVDALAKRMLELWKLLKTDQQLMIKEIANKISCYSIEKATEGLAKAIDAISSK